MDLSGIFAPLTTPFTSGGNVAISVLRENIRRYDRTRLAGYAMNGSASESVLLRWE
jgi:dihydrodipicolinate synthase/N-acetylneuraminate lyase